MGNDTCMLASKLCSWNEKGVGVSQPDILSPKLEILTLGRLADERGGRVNRGGRFLGKLSERPHLPPK